MTDSKTAQIQVTVHAKNNEVLRMLVIPSDIDHLQDTVIRLLEYSGISRLLASYYTCARWTHGDWLDDGVKHHLNRGQKIVERVSGTVGVGSRVSKYA